MPSLTPAYLQASLNLSDIASQATARTNLSLGSGNSPTFAGATINGNISIDAGHTIKLTEGGGSSVKGSATLIAGTATVSTAAVQTGDQIVLTCTAAGGTQGFPTVSISDGVSFTITSSNVADTSTYGWLLIKKV